MYGAQVSTLGDGVVELPLSAAQLNPQSQAGRELGAGRYLEVRYEALVRDPQQELERVCTFLEEEFVREMLDRPCLGGWADLLPQYRRRPGLPGRERLMSGPMVAPRVQE